MRGGERVVEALCRVFPQADLFTLTWDPERLSPALAQRRIITSPIHRVATAPFVSGRFRALLPLFPLAVESFNLDRYALVVSSSHCVAMGAIASPAALHVAYVHSTLRYVREAQPAYEASLPGGPIGRAVFRGAAHYLRRWEAVASARPHVLIANSTYTRERIRGYYQRDAQVIEPPIETGRFERAAASVPRGGVNTPFLLVSALVPNKRVDLALRAFQGRPERLLVVGEGPERARLERLVGPNVTLLSRVGEAELAALYAGCRALLHTGVDDFGMVMVEALAAGKPVLACAEGGALDIVRDGETGLLIDAPTVQGVRAALDRFERLSRRVDPAFDPATLQAFAKRFDRANFERRFADAVDDAWRRRRDARAHGTNGRHTNGNGSSRVARSTATLAQALPHERASNGLNGNGSNGHGTNGHGANGHSAKGHAQNGHGTNGHAQNGHSQNGHGANGHSQNGHGANGHAQNGHGANGHAQNGHGTNGHGVHGGLEHGHSANGHAEPATARATTAVDAWTSNGANRDEAAHAAPVGHDAGKGPLHPRAGLAAKRLADVTLATAGLVLTAPLMAALGALIVIESDGPALFFQRRTGRDQRPFTLIKLRTMDDDGRVTRVGRFLRPMGLDELPQLWNVLKGDMSLIGPRPEMPERVERIEQHLPGYRARHSMRPGITGWAQVNGLRGNKSPMAERLRFDIQYLQDWSLPLDGRILTRTVSTVLGETIRSLRE